MAKRHLTTFDEVVAEFGGVPALARYVGRPTNAIYNWKRERGKFPAVLYWKMNHALAARDATAEPSLWQFEGAPEVGAKLLKIAAA